MYIIYSAAKRAQMQLTKKQQQWLWFIGLWLGGLGSVLLVARIIRIMLGL